MVSKHLRIIVNMKFKLLNNPNLMILKLKFKHRNQICLRNTLRQSGRVSDHTSHGTRLTINRQELSHLKNGQNRSKNSTTTRAFWEPSSGSKIGDLQRLMDWFFPYLSTRTKLNSQLISRLLIFTNCLIHSCLSILIR